METRPQKPDDRLTVAPHRERAQRLGPVRFIEPPVRTQFPDQKPKKTGQKCHDRGRQGPGDHDPQKRCQGAARMPLKVSANGSMSLAATVTTGKCLIGLIVGSTSRFRQISNRVGRDAPNRREHGLGREQYWRLPLAEPEPFVTGIDKLLDPFERATKRRHDDPEETRNDLEDQAVPGTRNPFDGQLFQHQTHPGVEDERRGQEGRQAQHVRG